METTTSRPLSPQTTRSRAENASISEKKSPYPNSDVKDPHFASINVEAEKEPGFYQKYRIWVHLVCWLGITAYFIAAMIKSPSRDPIVLPMLYAFVTLKLMFEHVSTSIITHPLGLVWNTVVSNPMSRVPEKVKNIIGVFIVAACIITAAVAQPDSNVSTRLQRLMSVGGLCAFLIVLYVTSNNRKAINWRIVTVGIFLQFLLGIFVLKTPVGFKLFSWIAGLATTFLEYSKDGFIFVFGKEAAELHIFAVAVLPAILFFASFISIVYYWGAMQWIIKKFAWAMVRLMDTSGSESVVAAASPFVGQGESALLVKPFIAQMTNSELHSTMCSGFATIAGSVLIAYISFGINPQSLITACVMSVPCSLAVSKMRYPEEEESLSKGHVTIPETEDRESNFLHAAANGAAQGTELVALIVGTLIAVISLLALVNGFLGYFGSFVGFPNLTLTAIVKYIFVPFAWFIGVPTQDVMNVASLMAEKMFVNEFVAYMHLASLKTAKELTLRSELLATFSLCGFANFASIGVQVGCIGAMAENRKRDLAKLAFSAMLCGTMCTFMTATIAGILL